MAAAIDPAGAMAESGAKGGVASHVNSEAGERHELSPTIWRVVFWPYANMVTASSYHYSEPPAQLSVPFS